MMTGPTLGAGAIKALRAADGAEVLGRSDPGYESGRRPWNGMIDLSPAVIVRPRTAAAVAIAISVAQDQGLEIAVRGGGHNIAGQSSVEGGLLLDLAAMRAVTVDAGARRAVAEGGALLADLDSATTAAGLATTGGMVPHTGIGGLTLGGGYGYLARRHGLACDNLESVTLVTASGEILRVTDAADPELMWGIRGAGANFGVVTSFEYRLHPVGPEVTTGDVFFALEDAVPVIRALLDRAPELPNEILLFVAGETARSEHDLPPEQLGRPMITVGWSYLGDAEAGASWSPRSCGGQPLRRVDGRCTYFDVQAAGGKACRTAGGCTGSPPSCGRWTTRRSRRSRSRSSDAKTLAEVELVQMGGAIAHVGEPDTAYSHRDAEFDFLALSVWDDAAEDEARIADVRRAWSAVAPHAMAASYVNNLGDEGQERVRDAYGPAKYARLQALKDRHDPHNVFHRNQNVRPTTAVGSSGS
jgi:FAD/FMN-containing dehydrogenase